jgi:site-specific recombinase XerD
VRRALAAAEEHDARKITTGAGRAEEHAGEGVGLRYQVAAWLLSRRSADTRDGYAREITHWLAETGRQGIDPLRVTRTEGDAYTQALYEAGYSPASIRRKIAAISSFYSYAADQDWIARNPIRAVEVPARPRPSTRQAGEEEIRALMLAADTWVQQAPDARRRDEVVYAHRARALIYLLGGLGVRVNEVRLLDIEDIDRVAGRRRARFTAKGGEDVHRLIPDAVGQAIDDYLAASGDRTHGPLLATRTGNYLSRDKPWRILQQLAARAGVRISSHMLRVAFITVSLESGHPIQDVADAANHASIDQTQNYNRARHALDKDPSAHRMTLLTAASASTSTGAGSGPLTDDERAELYRLRAERDRWTHPDKR